MRRKLSNTLPVHLVIVAALATALPSFAFDFGSITDAVKNIDINKVVDTTKKLVEATTEMSEADEIALGDDLTARLLGAMPPVADPAVQTYVNSVGRWLSLQTDRPNLPWRFIVTDTDSIGAFAVPGGSVVITSGLMQLMRDENELAGVLAHEIAHVVEKHHLRAIMKQARTELAKDMTAELAQAYLKKNAKLTDALLNSGMKLYASGLSQADEMSSDVAGSKIAARGGYDPLGLLLVLTTLDTINTEEPRMAVMFSTHPPTAERIDNLAQAPEPIADRLDSTLNNPDRFQIAQKGLFKN